MRYSDKQKCDSLFDMPGCIWLSTFHVQLAPDMEKKNATEPTSSHPTSTLLLQIVSQDIFNSEHKQYLITVDHCSEFYKLDDPANTLSTTIISLTKAHFACHSIPLRFLSDNGPQFVSHEYKHFAQTFGLEHVTSSSYWSRKNDTSNPTTWSMMNVLSRWLPWKCPFGHRSKLQKLQLLPFSGTSKILQRSSFTDFLMVGIIIVFNFYHRIPSTLG